MRAATGRAIAGLSMGGFGAMSYAARHPDRFAAASFSGAVDTNNPLDQAVTDDKPFGPRATEEVRWRASNPWDLADNLRPLRLAVRTGNGQPGGPFGGGDVRGARRAPDERRLPRPPRRAAHPARVGRLRAGRPPVALLAARPPPHAALAHATFERPPAPPRRVSFRAVEPRYHVFGWSVALRRRTLEWSALRRREPRGFELLGSGTAKVRTAPDFAPRARVRVDGRMRRADAAGRLHVAVTLGPGNPAQALTPGATTRVFAQTVTLRPQPPAPAVLVSTPNT